MPMPSFRKTGQMAASAPEAPAPSTEAKPERRNAFGAKCASCGAWVEAEQGSLSKIAGQWIVRHFPECPGEGAPEAPAKTDFVQNHVGGQPLFDGIYTYETATAYRTFRLRTQPLDADFMPGKQIIEVLMGRDNDNDYERIGHLVAGRNGADATLKVWKRWQGRTTIVEAAEAFVADPHGPAVTPSVACYRCGRTLTVPASVHNGLGPECAKKGL